MYSEKDWEHGWSLDGYPYLSSTSHFLRVPSAPSGSGTRSPSWAPRYPYPAACGGEKTSSSSKEPQRTSKERLAADVHSLMHGVNDVIGSIGSPNKLPDEALEALDALEVAFQSSDPEALMSAIQQLGQLYDSSQLSRRAEELLGDAPLKKCRNLQIAALESEILKRFAKAFAQQPERTKEFVQSGLPEQLLAPLQRHRMVRTVREMTSGAPASSATGSAETSLPSRSGIPSPYQAWADHNGCRGLFPDNLGWQKLGASVG